MVNRNPQMPPSLPLPPRIPAGGILLGQNISGINAEDFFKCPICGSEVVYVPCGKVIQFDVESMDKPVNIKMLDIMVNLGNGQALPFPPNRFLFCLGDCKRPFTMQELAAIVYDKKKTAEQKPEEKKP